MKKLLYATMISLLFVNLAQGQDKGDTKSPPCITGPSTIEVGGSYTFTSNGLGQCSTCYDWDESTSIANISGSDQNSTVVINPTAVGTFTLNLTYFGEFGCRTCSKTVTVIQDMIDCSNCDVNIVVQGNSSNSTCTSATATLVGCDNPSSNPIVDVDWSWAMAGTACGNPYPNACPISTPNMFQATIPIGTITGTPPPYHYLQMYALVTYADGTTTCYDWDQELLICDGNYTGGGGGKGLHNLSISPNPAINGSIISFTGVDYKDITTIEVLDIAGNGRSGGTPSDQTFDIGNLSPGIYIVQFTSVTNEVVQKKLVIE